MGCPLIRACSLIRSNTVCTFKSADSRTDIHFVLEYMYVISVQIAGLLLIFDFVSTLYSKTQLCTLQEKLYGREVILADRDMVELESGKLTTILHSVSVTKRQNHPNHHRTTQDRTES